MTQTFASPEDELTQRHKLATLAVIGMIGLTVVLIALAFAGVFVSTTRQPDPFIEGVLRITIVFFGIGAVALRRTKFNAARLQDIASVRGTSALLGTLQNTTILVALLGGAIALMGFFIAMSTGDGYDMLWIGIIAAAVLFYAYPRRRAWQRVVEATQATNGAPAPPTPSVKGTIA